MDVEAKPKKTHQWRMPDVMTFLGMTQAQVRRAVRERGLPAIQPGKELEFDEAEVVNWRLAQKPRTRAKRKRAAEQP